MNKYGIVSSGKTIKKGASTKEKKALSTDRQFISGGLLFFS